MIIQHATQKFFRLFLSALIIFIFLKKKYFTKNKKYWNNQKNDPYLFNVNLLESLDIDTEEEFLQVEKIYSSMKD